MEGMEVSLFELRQELIGELKGKTLDVGSGTGVNYEHFNSDTEVISIEPSQYMLEKAKSKLSENQNISTYNLGINDTELNNIIEHNSLDNIVCTLVLCTIPNPELALQKMYDWLKPNGKLVILEHIHSENKINRGLQNLANPVWKVVADGCNLNRDTDILIKSAGFKPLNNQYFKRGLRFYSGVFVKK